MDYIQPEADDFMVKQPSAEREVFMKIKVIIVLLVIAAAGVLYFSKSMREQAKSYVKPHVVSVVGTPEEKAISTLEEMYKAMQQEDMEKTLSFVAESQREKMKAQLQQTFSDFDLVYKLSNMKVLPAKDGDIQIELTLEITGTGKDRFRNRSERGIATLTAGKTDVYFVSFKSGRTTYLQR